MILKSCRILFVFLVEIHIYLPKSYFLDLCRILGLVGFGCLTKLLILSQTSYLPPVIFSFLIWDWEKTLLSWIH